MYFLTVLSLNKLIFLEYNTYPILNLCYRTFKVKPFSKTYFVGNNEDDNKYKLTKPSLC